MVVVLVVGGGRQPFGPHASQQLACAPTQRPPVQREASRLIPQRTRPEVATRQQVTAPGRPQVDCAAQRRSGFTHSGRSMLLAACARITPSAQRTYSLWLVAVAQEHVASTSARAAAMAAASPGSSPQAASTGAALATIIARASKPGAKRMADTP